MNIITSGMRGMLISVGIALVAGAVAVHAQSLPPSGDLVTQSLFRRFPFEKWAAAGDHADIHWAARVLPPLLSGHQRIVTGFEALVDGREMFKRRGHGQLIAMVRVRDAAGHSWNTGTWLDLSDIPETAKASDYTITQQAFVLPGDYDAEIAVADTQTGDYSFARRKLHVAALRNDPLPNAWDDLPAVEMIPTNDLPDAWYIPEILNHLRIAAGNERPVHVEVLMNITPSERASGSLRVFRRNMGLLIPALKSLAGLAPVDGGMDLTISDLVQHAAVAQQKGVRELDWSSLRKAFAETTPGMVDAKTLALERTMKQYFRDQVERHADTQQGPRILVVLSAPVTFEKQEEIAPLNLPPDPNRKVIYIRFRPLFQPVIRRGRGGGPNMPVQMAPPPLEDDLERILKPLTPRVVTVTQPLEFRKALARVIEDINRLGQPHAAASGAAGETVPAANR
jgi:hypothetical protein